MHKPDFFDNWEYNQILPIAAHDLHEAIKQFEQYFEKHPKDYSQYPYYISYLSTIGEFELAQEKINFITKQVYSDQRFLNNKEKLSQFEKNLLFTKTKLLSNLEKYEEIIKLLEPYYGKLEEFGLVAVYFYACVKTNKIEKDRDSITTYLFRQIIEYREEDFLEHIQKHLPNYNMELDNPNKNIFAIDFPLTKVLEEIKKYIPSSQCFHHGFFDVRYFFKYDNCGRENNKITDYFVVSCFNNSPNIITMCPSSRYQIGNCIDLNYLKNDDEKTKSKRLSQIDKFNQKYTKK